MRRITALLVLVLLTGLLAGCIAPPTAQDAQQEVVESESVLCASIDAYAASVEALHGVTAETTVAELEALKEAEASAYAAMVAAWGDLQEAEVQAVESAVNDFHASLNDIDPEETLGEVATSIQTSAATVTEAVDQLDQEACAPAE